MRASGSETCNRPGVPWRSICSPRGPNSACVGVCLCPAGRVCIVCVAGRDCTVCCACRLRDIISTYNSSHVYLVLEYLDCDLRHYLNTCPGASALPVVKVTQPACTPQQLHLVQSSVPGLTLTQAEVTLCFGTLQSVIYQILSGIAYLHANSILHRDIKPQNVLVEYSTSTIKITDFGLARSFLPPSKPCAEKVSQLGITLQQVTAQTSNVAQL